MPTEPAAPRKFRKKPVVIEAMRFDGANGHAIEAWARASNPNGPCDSMQGYDGRRWIQIVTLEGTMAADIGDWVIRGIKGEFYPCKPNIFEATYEPAD